MSLQIPGVDEEDEPAPRSAAVAVTTPSTDTVQAATAASSPTKPFRVVDRRNEPSRTSVRITELPPIPSSKDGEELAVFRHKLSESISGALRQAQKKGEISSWTVVRKNGRERHSQETAEIDTVVAQQTAVYLHGGLGGTDLDNTTVTGMAIPGAVGTQPTADEGLQHANHGDETVHCVLTLRQDAQKAAEALGKGGGLARESVGGLLSETKADFTLTVSAIPSNPERRLAKEEAELNAIVADAQESATEFDSRKKALATEQGHKVGVLDAANRNGAFAVRGFLSAPNPESLDQILSHLDNVPAPFGHHWEPVADANNEPVVMASLSEATEIAAEPQGVQIPLDLASQVVPAFTLADKIPSIKKKWTHPFDAGPGPAPAREHVLGTFVSPNGENNPLVPVGPTAMDAKKSMFFLGSMGTGKTTLMERVLVNRALENPKLTLIALDASDGKRELSEDLPAIYPRPLLRAAYDDSTGLPDGVFKVKVNPFRVREEGENLLKKITRQTDYLAFDTSGAAGDKEFLRGAMAAGLRELYKEAGYDLNTGLTKSGRAGFTPTLAMLKSKVLEQAERDDQGRGAKWIGEISSYVSVQFGKLEETISDGHDGVALEKIFESDECGGMVAHLGGLGGENKMRYACMLVAAGIDHAARTKEPVAIAIDELANLIYPGSPLVPLLTTITSEGRASNISLVGASATMEKIKEANCLEPVTKALGQTISTEWSAHYLGLDNGDKTERNCITEMREHEFVLATGRRKVPFRTLDPELHPLVEYEIPAVRLEQLLPNELPSTLAHLLSVADEETRDAAVEMATSRSLEGQENGIIAYLNGCHVMQELAPQEPAWWPAISLREEYREPYQELISDGELTKEGHKIALAVCFNAADVIARLNPQYRNRMQNPYALWDQVIDSTMHSLGLGPQPGCNTEARSTIHFASGAILLRGLAQKMPKLLETATEEEASKLLSEQKFMATHLSGYLTDLGSPQIVPRVPGVQRLPSNTELAVEILKKHWVGVGGDEGLYKSVVDACGTMIAESGVGKKIFAHQFERCGDMVDPVSFEQCDSIIRDFHKWSQEYLRVDEVEPEKSAATSADPAALPAAPPKPDEPAATSPDPTPGVPSSGADPGFPGHRGNLPQLPPAVRRMLGRNTADLIRSHRFVA